MEDRMGHSAFDTILGPFPKPQGGGRQLCTGNTTPASSELPGRQAGTKAGWSHMYIRTYVRTAPRLQGFRFRRRPRL